MAAYSCTYAYRKLTRPGTSAEIKYMFVRKHITYVITFSLIWMTYLCYTFFNLKFTYKEVNLCSNSNASKLDDATKRDCEVRNVLLYVS
jgi:hypothetical protein